MGPRSVSSSVRLEVVQLGPVKVQTAMAEAPPASDNDGAKGKYIDPDKIQIKQRVIADICV